MKDRTAVNHKIRKHFNELIYNVARYTEVVLSIVILVVIALAGLRLIPYNCSVPPSWIWIPVFLPVSCHRLSPLQLVWSL